MGNFKTAFLYVLYLFQLQSLSPAIYCGILDSTFISKLDSFFIFLFFFVPSPEPKFEKITKMYKMGTPPLVYCYPLLIATFEIRSLLCVLGFVGLVKYFMLSRVIMYYLKYILYFKTYDVLFASEIFFYFVCKISLCLCAIVYTLYFNFLHTYILYYYIN